MVADFAFSDLREHLDSLVPARPPVMQRMEEYAAEHDFPIIGPAAGYFCYLVAKMLGARTVYELGSGYGYSTAWFAKAVQENGGGVVHHVVWDEELSALARKHLGVLGYPATDSRKEGITKIDYTVGEAVAAFREVSGPFDIVFNDIDKVAYPDTVEVVEARLRPGGAFITDNLIWGGRVLTDDSSPETVAIRRFTSMIAESPAWDGSVIPIRDGLMLAIRK